MYNVLRFSVKTIQAISAKKKYWNTWIAYDSMLSFSYLLGSIRGNSICLSLKKKKTQLGKMS